MGGDAICFSAKPKRSDEGCVRLSDESQRANFVSSAAAAFEQGGLGFCKALRRIDCAPIAAQRMAEHPPS